MNNLKQQSRFEKFYAHVQITKQEHAEKTESIVLYKQKLINTIAKKIDNKLFECFEVAQKKYDGNIRCNVDYTMSINLFINPAKLDYDKHLIGFTDDLNKIFKDALEKVDTTYSKIAEEKVFHVSNSHIKKNALWGGLLEPLVLSYVFSLNGYVGPALFPKIEELGKITHEKNSLHSGLEQVQEKPKKLVL